MHRHVNDFKQNRVASCGKMIANNSENENLSKTENIL